MNELIERRTENSKTFALGGNKRRSEISSVIIHYKDDYSNAKGLWKDIDLTPDTNGDITKAPYTAIHNNGSIVFTDRKTGDSVTIKPSKIGTKEASLSDVSLIVFPEGIKLQREIKSDTDALTAEYDIEVKGKSVKLQADAVDLDGKKVSITYKIESGKLTETVSLKTTDSIGQEIPVKYPIKIDPTLTVQPCAKDCFISSYAVNDNYDNYGSSLWIEKSDTAIIHTLLEFDISAMPVGATISSAVMSLYYASAAAGTPAGRTYTASRLLRRDWVAAQATYNIYKTDSNWTTAGAGSDGNDYTSADAIDATMPATGNWCNWTITEQVKTAYAGSFTADFKIVDKNASGATRHIPSLWNQHYVVDTDLCPKLVIDYTEGTGWANIAKVMDIASADMAKINGVAVADIAKLNSVTV